MYKNTRKPDILIYDPNFILRSINALKIDLPLDPPRHNEVADEYDDIMEYYDDIMEYDDKRKKLDDELNNIQNHIILGIPFNENIIINNDKQKD